MSMSPLVEPTSFGVNDDREKKQKKSIFWGELRQSCSRRSVFFLVFLLTLTSCCSEGQVLNNNFQAQFGPPPPFFQQPGPLYPYPQPPFQGHFIPYPPHNRWWNPPPPPQPQQPLPLPPQDGPISFTFAILDPFSIPPDFYGPEPIREEVWISDRVDPIFALSGTAFSALSEDVAAAETPSIKQKNETKEMNPANKGLPPFRSIRKAPPGSFFIPITTPEGKPSYVAEVASLNTLYQPQGDELAFKKPKPIRPTSKNGERPRGRGSNSNRIDNEDVVFLGESKAPGSSSSEKTSSSSSRGPRKKKQLNPRAEWPPLVSGAASYYYHQLRQSHRQRRDANMFPYPPSQLPQTPSDHHLQMYNRFPPPPPNQTQQIQMLQAHGQFIPPPPFFQGQQTTRPSPWQQQGFGGGPPPPPPPPYPSQPGPFGGFGPPAYPFNARNGSFPAGGSGQGSNPNPTPNQGPAYYQSQSRHQSPFIGNGSPWQGNFSSTSVNPWSNWTAAYNNLGPFIRPPTFPILPPNQGQAFPGVPPAAGLGGPPATSGSGQDVLRETNLPNPTEPQQPINNPQSSQSPFLPGSMAPLSPNHKPPTGLILMPGSSGPSEHLQPESDRVLLQRQLQRLKLALQEQQRSRSQLSSSSTIKRRRRSRSSSLQFPPRLDSRSTESAESNFNKALLLEQLQQLHSTSRRGSNGIDDGRAPGPTPARQPPQLEQLQLQQQRVTTAASSSSDDNNNMKGGDKGVEEAFHFTSFEDLMAIDITPLEL